MRSKLLTTFIDTLPRPHHPLQRLRPSSTLCAHCTRPLNTLDPTPSSRPSHRTLTTTTPLLKKGGKQDSKRTVPLNAAKALNADPFHFSDYEAAIARAHAHLKSELAKIKAGGLDVEGVENVRVQLVKGAGKGGKGMVRVGDVASVVVRGGRNVGVLVGETDHIKPILSSLRSPPANLNPTTSPTDPQTLLIPIPPTTQESRRASQAVASKKGEEALFALREARGAQRKKHRAMELGKLVGPDELRRAEAAVEKINGEAVGEAKRLVEGCRKGLEGG